MVTMSSKQSFTQPKNGPQTSNITIAASR